MSRRRGRDHARERMPAALVAVAIAAGAAAGDPTRPPGPQPDVRAEAGTEPGAGTAAQRLTSIVVSPSRSVATIDGRTVRVGDSVAGARVVAIDLHRVRLRDAQGEFTLSLSSPPVKGPAGAGSGVPAAAEED